MMKNNFCFPFNFKKEIATLKDQVNKCKQFLNTLTSNPVWQDGHTNFNKHDILVNQFTIFYLP